MNFDQPPKSKAVNVKEVYETGESKVSFFDDCLRVTSGFEVVDGREKRRLEYDSPDARNVFGQNNGFLAFVTRDGLKYVTIATSEKVQELESMGYRDTGLGVPLSNNESPADQNDLEKWKKIVGGKK